MKTIKFKNYILLILILVIFLNVESRAQLKVTNSGNVGIGYSDPGLKLAVNGSALVHYDNHLYLNYGTDYHWKFGKDYSLDNVISLYGVGNNFIRRFRIFGYGSLVGDAEVFYVSFRDGTTWSNSGFYSGSDASIKENIEKITGALNKVQKLQGVKYTLKNKSSNPDSLITDDVNKRHIGLIAQEVEKIVPEVVIESANGTLAIDYSKLTAILIEALKEQQIQIDELKNIVESSSKSYLDNKTTNNSNPDNKTSQVLQENILTNSLLYQNTPNPFSEKTEIRYSVSNDASSAFIYIFNMQGKLIESLPIEDKGNGFIAIDGYKYEPGMYIYSLLVNGQEVDSKRMILTE